jgi:hypothetical protein
MKLLLFAITAILSLALEAPAASIPYPDWFNPKQASKTYHCGDVTLTFDFVKGVKSFDSPKGRAQEVITGVIERTAEGGRKKMWVGALFFDNFYSDGTVEDTVICQEKWNE